MVSRAVQSTMDVANDHGGAGGKGKKGRDNFQARDKHHYKTITERRKDDAERAGNEKGEYGVYVVGGDFFFFFFFGRCTLFCSWFHAPARG